MLLGVNGIGTVFEVDKLQAQIIHCFLTAGLRESYLAEDIALAVEHALSASSRPEKVFAETEINAAVVKILEDVGFPEVAAIFRSLNSCIGVTLSSEGQTIAELIRRHLDVDEMHLNYLTGQVLNAAKTLKISTAPPALYLELAKYYKSLMTTVPLELHVNVTRSGGRRMSGSSSLLLTPEMVYGALGPQGRRLIDEGIVRLLGVGKLFPSIRLFFMMTDYVRHCNLAVPVAEMLLIPHLYEAAEVLRDCCRAANTLYGAEVKEHAGSLPVYLTVPDLSRFAIEQLQGSWPESKGTCLELLEPLRQSIGGAIFKLKVN